MLTATLILALLSLLVATDSDPGESCPRSETRPSKPKMTLRSVPLHLPAHVLLLAFSLLLTGCVSSRYQEAPKATPPPTLLNASFAPAPLEATLNTVITYNGPGSWKRDAYWDEYVVTLHNPGSQPLVVAPAGLVDFAGTLRPARIEPWALEKESKTLERQYKDIGIAFVRYTTPGVLIVGAGVAAISSAGIFSAAASGAATATVIVLPLYYVGVLTINHYNKVAMETEFNRRRLPLPLTLAPGETRTGSCFFPMVPNPRSLSLHWSTGQDTGESVLPLDFLRGLHVNAPAPAITAK